MSLIETLGSVIAVLLVVTIILVFWTLLWKYFLSKLKFLREICKFSLFFNLIFLSTEYGFKTY